nr:hypothetical protein [Rhodococcus sp. (in: high G+C Gram-positive bacteria)]
MNSARRALAVVTVALGAFVAGLAMATPVSRNFAFVVDGDRLDVIFSSATAASGLCAVVAVIVAAAVRRTTTAFVATGLGTVLLATGILLQTSLELQQRGLAAGLILGGCAALTGKADRRILQCAVVVGLVSALVAAGPLERDRLRYRDYLAPTPQTYMIVLVAVFAALLVLAGVLSILGASPTRAPATIRVLLVGIAVPVAGLMLYWLFVRSVMSIDAAAGTELNRWTRGLAVVPLLVGAAYALPGASGAVVLAALAYLATATASFEPATAVVFFALMVTGTAVGLRRPSPLSAMVILAVVAAAGLFANSSLDAIDNTAQFVLLPFATGLVFASLVPTLPSALTISVTVPIAVSVPIVAEFGWTAYTPLTSGTPSFSPSAWDWMSTSVSVLSVAAAGVALAVLLKVRASSVQ